MMHAQLERHPRVVTGDDRALPPVHHAGERGAGATGALEHVGVGPSVLPGERGDLHPPAQSHRPPQEADRGEHGVSDHEHAQDRRDGEDVAAAEEPQPSEHRGGEQQHDHQDHQEPPMRRNPADAFVVEDVAESCASSQRVQVYGHRLHDSIAHGPLRFSDAAAWKSDQPSPNFSNDFSSTLPSVQCMTRPTM